MRSLLFIPAKSSTGGYEDHYWHAYNYADCAGSVEIEYNLPSADRMFYNEYLSRVVAPNESGSNCGETLIFLPTKNEFIFASKRGFFGKAGMLLVSYDEGLLCTGENQQIPAALYIGSSPNWIKSDISYKDIRENLSYLWLIKKENGYCAFSLFDVLLPAIDKLVLGQKSGQREQRVLFFGTGFTQTEKLAETIKAVLLSLPVEISNRFEFNTNATTVAAVNAAFISGTVSLTAKDLAELSSDVCRIDIENGIKNYSPESNYGKYIKEISAIPKNIEIVNSKTIDELEQRVSEVKLLTLCSTDISQSNIETCIRLYSESGEDVRKRIVVKKAFARLAHRIFFSSKYFSSEKNVLSYMSQFLSTDKEVPFNQIADVLPMNGFLDLFDKNGVPEGQAFLQSLNSIANSNCYPEMKQKICNFLYGKSFGSKDALKKAFASFMGAMQPGDFDAYLLLLKEATDPDFIGIIKNAIKKKYPHAKGRIAHYKQIRNKGVYLHWAIYDAYCTESMRYFEDLAEWNTALELFNSAEQVALKECFIPAFKLLLQNEGYFEKPKKVLEKLKNHLDVINATATNFNFTDSEFINKHAEIEKYIRDLAECDRKRRLLFDRRPQIIREAATATKQGLIDANMEKIEQEHYKKLIGKSNKRTNLVNLKAGLSWQVVLSLLISVGMLAVLSAWAYGGSWIHWELYNLHFSVNAAFPLKTLFVFAPILICVLLYIILISVYRKRKYNSWIIAIRTLTASMCSVVIPYMAFLITVFAYFQLN